MGRLFSIQSVKAVISITLRFPEIHSWYVIVLYFFSCFVFFRISGIDTVTRVPFKITSAVISIALSDPAVSVVK